MKENLMKPVIGIFPSLDEEEKRIYTNNLYFDEVMNSGGIPVIIPVTDDIEVVSETIKHIDGLILSGGWDIDPEYYTEKNEGKSKNISVVLDKAEALLIKLAIEADIPILGICRGMQALNVFCGGSLYQDIPSEYETQTIHNKAKPDVAFHNITVLPDTLLSEIIGTGEVKINSYHHQAVKKIAPGFEAAAYSEDGLIEAIYRKDKKFVLGVQWHPERSHNEVPTNKIILNIFIKTCADSCKA